MGAHRMAWIIAYGSIPQGLCVLHRCDNPPCVRPDHLFLGTKGDNNRDCVAKGRGGYTGLPGERNGRAKLQPADILAIQARYATGESRFALAEEFSITPAYAWAVGNRKSWKHLNDIHRENGSAESGLTF